MKKFNFVVFTILVMATTGLSGQTKSGIILVGGRGKISAKVNPTILEKIISNEIDYKSNYALGYRFRFHHSYIPQLFFDADANLGMRIWHSSYIRSYNEPPIYGASSQWIHISGGTSANYLIGKKFSVGLGLEPTYFISQNGEKSKNKFDVPIFAKIAYNFSHFELGLSYKHGLLNTIKTDYLDSGRFRDVQLSVWIPF